MTLPVAGGPLLRKCGSRDDGVCREPSVQTMVFLNSNIGPYDLCASHLKAWAPQVIDPIGAPTEIERDL